MTPLEKIEDDHKNLIFHFVQVPFIHYRGHIDGNNIYINKDDSMEIQCITALHEINHFEYDRGDLTQSNISTMLRAEKFARKHAQLDFYKMYYDR